VSCNITIYLLLIFDIALLLIKFVNKVLNIFFSFLDDLVCLTKFTGNICILVCLAEIFFFDHISL